MLLHLILSLQELTVLDIIAHQKRAPSSSRCLFSSYIWTQKNSVQTLVESKAQISLRFDNAIELSSIFVRDLRIQYHIGPQHVPDHLRSCPPI